MSFVAGAQFSTGPSLVLAPESALSLLPSRGLSSAPVVRSVSARAVLSNGETKKELDFRSAFRHDRRQQSCSLSPTGRLSGARSDCQAASAVDLEHREPEAGLRLLPRGDEAQSGASSRYTGGPQQTAKSAEAPQVTAPITLLHSSRWRHLDFCPRR